MLGQDIRAERGAGPKTATTRSTGPGGWALLAAVTVALAGCGAPARSSNPADGTGETASTEAEAPGDLVATEVDGIRLEPRTVVDGKVTLLVPSEFTEMDEEMLSAKYPAERRPTLVYTDETGGVNVAVNHTRDRMPSKELGRFHETMDEMFRNLYPSAEWFESDIEEINGREWFLLDLRTPGIDTEIRNRLIGTSLDNRLLLVTFNVITGREAEWMGAGSAIVGSVRVEE